MSFVLGQKTEEKGGGGGRVRKNPSQDPPLKKGGGKKVEKTSGIKLLKKGSHGSSLSLFRWKTQEKKKG